MNLVRIAVLTICLVGWGRAATAEICDFGGPGPVNDPLGVVAWLGLSTTICGTTVVSEDSWGSDSDEEVLADPQVEREVAFIRSNLTALRRDVAMTSGPYLTAYLRLIGCGGDLQKAGDLLRHRYQQVFATTIAVAVRFAFRNVLARHPDTAEACGFRRATPAVEYFPRSDPASDPVGETDA